VTLTTSDFTLAYLSPAAARLGGVFARPRAIAILCIVALTGLGWIYLGLLVGGGIAAGGDFLSLFGALCRPANNAAFLMPSVSWAAADLALADLALAFLMWGAMTLAMMLPSAGPMILTYAEIADTAARQREQIVSPFLLAAGYAAIWLGFALVACLLQVAMTRAALIDDGMGPASGLLSGVLFLGAGLYQFSALKQACLTLCQRPFPFLFVNWTTKAAGVFRLGLRQGLHCLGCCWAMMLLMFALGVMNIAWMAALGILMTAEKLFATPRMSRLLGAAFVAIGLAFIFTEAVGAMHLG
jgi:predicted metal-binding membrane protein